MKQVIFLTGLLIMFSGCSSRIREDEAIQAARTYLSATGYDTRSFRWEASWKQGAWQIKLTPVPNRKLTSGREKKISSSVPLRIEVDRRGDIAGFM